MQSSGSCRAWGGSWAQLAHGLDDSYLLSYYRREAAGEEPQGADLLAVLVIVFRSLLLGSWPVAERASPHERRRLA